MPQSILALVLLLTLVLLGNALPGVGIPLLSIVERRPMGVLNSISPSSLPVSLRDLPWEESRSRSLGCLFKD